MDLFLSQPNTPTSIIATLALILLIYHLSTKLKTLKTKPPQAAGALPIIGHLHLLGGTPQLPHITLGAMADNYGSIFTIRLGLHLAVVVSDWEVAKELFTTYDVAISSRPKYIAARYLGYDYAMFGFSAYGPYWREMRKITSIELLSTRRLELLRQNMIAGGSDTPSVMLIWALALLLNNPNTLKQAQEELDIHVGRERQVDESDINKLVYLQAIVKETFRLYPAGPLGGIREFTEDCNVSGYHIQKGRRLILNLWKLQRDPKVWSNPLEFRPERFLTTHKDVDVKGQHFELLPFGAGRRLCPGTAFGIQILHSVLATLLHSFELSTPSDAPVDMTESAGLTNLKATPLHVLVAPRLPSHLY